MAAKKGTTPKPPKPKSVKRVQRESPIDPGHMMPVEPPQLHHMTPEQRSFTHERVGAAVEQTTGRGFNFHDAVATRVNAVMGGVHAARAETERTGVRRLPTGHYWYNEHQAAGRETASETGAPLGRTIDTSAALSVRNAPEHERTAAKSAMHIAMNPQQTVHVSQALAPHVGSWESRGSQGIVQTSSLRPGTHRLGDLSTREVASLGAGAAKVEYAGERQRPAPEYGPAGGHTISPEVGNVTRRAAGRPAAERGLQIARGKPFSEVSDAPKTASYAVAAHTASAAQKTHNENRMYELTYGAGKPGQSIPEQIRSAHALAHPETGQQAWSHDEMYPGHREKVLAAHRHDPTAEDYVMNAMTVHRAHSEGREHHIVGGSPEWSVNKALDVVGHAVKKGKESPLPAEVTTEQMLHGVNTAATHMAARRLGLTPVATQAESWIHHRRAVLGEDSEWNAQQTQIHREKQAALKPPKAHPGGIRGQQSLFNDRRYAVEPEQGKLL